MEIEEELEELMRKLGFEDIDIKLVVYPELKEKKILKLWFT